MRLYAFPEHEAITRMQRLARVAEVISRNSYLFEDARLITAIGDAKGCLEVSFAHKPSDEICGWIEQVWSITENECMCEFFVGGRDDPQ